MPGRQVFVTGGTGYVGVPLIAALLARGHVVTALARRTSAPRVARGARTVVGDALDAATYAAQVPRAATFVHLVGVPHPSPAKATEFRTIDLASVRASVEAARAAAAAHVVYMSVAHPAPVMQAYVAARTTAEDLIAGSGVPATFLRPWYVLGPGHRWPHLLAPFYWVAERLPGTRDTARRLGLVTLDQMVAALADAVESPPASVRIVEVPEIRAARLR